ncbi:SRSF protein kinase 3-like isoform X1 [Python bivittatus]|uniref:non-specific serine/threonine protein kinase n=2 Tax=Python bivittatus TaxID=176946 RepID=A0A9F2QX67_PYTBI|nr:SRSF protein kinase 3-like isoform X1 [Python bivittatus]XP_025023283.1 SRSF protein kinase 3-like isoform X1 [Python bivittatus]
MEEPFLTTCEEGYYLVKKGETFNGRYHVVQNLGYGYFSTVWLCQDTGKKRCVAVKVPKGGENFAEAALDEVMLLRCVNSKRRKDQGSKHIIHLLDDFKMIGENGFHVCLVMELLGPSLQTLLSIRGSQGLPLPFVKKTMRQVLQGLHFLHKECRIIHTDIKPDNILLYVTEESLQDMVSLEHGMRANQKSRTGEDGPAALLDCCNLMKMGVKIADLGSACWTYKPFSKKIQTQPYRALEVLLGLEYSTPADIWSTACVAFELATGKHLFEPQAGQYFSRDDDHVARIIELLGKIPPKIALLWKQTSTFFSRQGALLRMSWISFYDLYHILIDKYSWPKPQATLFTCFLLPMLEYVPERRARADKCLQHPWLSP